MRARILAALAAGFVVVGIAGWPVAAPAIPGGAVTLQAGHIGIGDGMIFLVLALAAGAIAYFAAWPYGRDIAVLAAPAGLALWATRTGSMAALLRLNMGLTADQTFLMRRQALAAMQWESLFWIAIVAAGYAGVRLAARFVPASKPVKDEEIGNVNTRNAVNNVAAFVAAVVIGQFAMAVFAQDVRMSDSQLGSVIGQPGTGQIAFAAIVSFAIAAFVAKRCLDVSYIVPALATPVLAFIGIWLAAKPDVLRHMIENWPEAFFSRSISAVLPIQLVAFGSIGAVIGYWLAIKHAWWRKT